MLFVIAALWVTQQPSDSQNLPVRSEAAGGTRIVQAVKAANAPVVDGRLDDAVWSSTPVAGQFTQNYPRDGAAASARTEARVLFVGDALYVGMRAFDNPDSIMAPLSRRDVVTNSDYLHVLLDTFHDRRAAFHFMVNPAGVKVDVYHYDDVQVDYSWDAVWDVAVARDSLGWTAEFRIPLSQLRYQASNEGKTIWGINFFRHIGRTQEWSSWAPIPQGEHRLVSRFGDLGDIPDLPATRRREVTPFLTSSMKRGPGDRANPLFKPTALETSAGLDAKFGLTRGLTLDLTLHPDFGQVEADPSEVNLSGFETTFTEKRPFFVENGGLFEMSIYESPGEVLFYPRRIGRSPQLSADDRGGYVSAPLQTPILAAAKISGKTAGGLSVGLLDAVTEPVHADVRDVQGNSFRDLIEPRANYSVARIQQDFRAGRSSIGGMLTATHRPGLSSTSPLHSAAYSGGLDFRHRFGGASGSAYEVFGALFASDVRGSRESIIETQLSSAHYFQRREAPQFRLDSTRTSLSGYGARIQFDKSSGLFRFGNALYTRNPGFEVNDLGIQRNADWNEDFVWVGAMQTQPNKVFNNWSVYGNTWSWWTYGGERTFTQFNIDTNLELRNFWGSFLRLGRRLPARTLRLRGGPLLREDGGWLVDGNVYSPQQKNLRLQNGFFAYVSDMPGLTSLFWWPTLQWQPSSRISTTVGASYSRERSGIFYVAEGGLDTNPGYVVGSFDRTTLATTTRLDVTFTPALTLQLYAQPFLSAASYSDFKEVVAPVAARYDDRFRALNAQLRGGSYEADTNGDGAPDVRFDDPAFNVREFRSNAVMRWEYRPGSTLFVVWSQGRHASDDARFQLTRDAGNLFRTVPENVLLVKMTRWLSF
ncbi:MAG TPA: DUF5916 domain-containing protein [Gemmatimonadaceae bacterium]|nr:DUF5916 domain-containing protein [Gemmatimonadaceae bacterium]